jgi:hypothetical protein
MGVGFYLLEKIFLKIIKELAASERPNAMHNRMERHWPVSWKRQFIYFLFSMYNKPAYSRKEHKA